MQDEGITSGTAPMPDGQVDIAPITGTSGPAPDSTDGQPTGGDTPAATDGAGPQQQAEETFFDPESIKDNPELMTAYKQMQKAFTKKTQGIKEVQHKAEAYDQFNADPMQYMQTLAKQMGYSLNPAGQQQQEPGQSEEWQPETWTDVLSKAKTEARADIMKELEPYIGQLQDIRKQNIEKVLDNDAPDWREHEDSMMATLKKHPSMVNDPIALYRLSVPQEVLMSRATQQVLKKMEAKAKSAGTSGISTTRNKNDNTIAEPSSFDEAVKFAKAKLAAQA